MTKVIDRRAALGALAAGGHVLVSGVAEAATAGALPAHIAAHRDARAAYEAAGLELEAVWPASGATVRGLGAREYALRKGEGEISGWIDFDFERLAEPLRTISIALPNIQDALAALERERAGAQARVREAFAEYNAAQRRCKESSDAEETALTAICAYHCSPSELEPKFRYLSAFREELSEEQHEAIFASLLPEGEMTEA
jgi:hypothetical protein